MSNDNAQTYLLCSFSKCATTILGTGWAGGIKYASRRGDSLIAKDLIDSEDPKHICCFVAKVHLSRFARFFKCNIPILIQIFLPHL